jgi:hypothetical protein
MPIPHEQDDDYGYNDCFDCHKIVPVAILSILCYILSMEKSKQKITAPIFESFYDFDAMTKEAEERRKKRLEEEG